MNPHPPRSERSSSWPWLGALAVWLLAFAALRPLTLPDEGRYVGVAYAMTHGDLLTPRLHGLPYFHKPPLMYWVDAAAMRLLGANEFAARVAPAVGAWLMGAAIFVDLRRRQGLRVAAISLGVLATSPIFFVGGQFANLDMLVAGLICIAIVAGRRAADETDLRRSRRLALLAWIASAFAVLAKGLIGVVLPLLVLLPWLAARGRWADLRRWLHPAALLAFVVLALPWFVAMQLRYPGFADYFILEQHVRRYAQTGFNNAQPAWFFVPVLLLLMLPWTPWLLRYLRYRDERREDDVAFHAWWIAVVVGFFSLPTSKLVGYVLPAVGPLAALLGLAVRRGRAWRWVMPAAGLACIGAIVAIARHDAESHRAAARELRASIATGDAVAFVGGPFFDVPFYARLSAPPAVVLDWDDPSIAARDDWRKELHDAGRFDPQAAADLLVRPADAARLACGPGTLWIVSAPPTALPAAWAGGAQEVLRTRHTVLWRLPRSRSCP